MNTVICATLLCDLKVQTQLMAVPAALRLTAPPDCKVVYYLNIETDRIANYYPVQRRMYDSGRTWHYDYWHRDSTWSKRDVRDQDQSRLEPICVARNMARAYAVGSGAQYLLFIDSDVVVPEDGLERLMALSVNQNASLVGGMVPGRGAHGGAWYIFGEEWRRGHVVGCAHGTLGYCLIRRDLFEVIAFRWGPHPIERGVMLSEDPAFAADARVHFGATWLIDLDAKAQHLDDPERPLVLEEAQNDYHVPAR